MQGSYVFGPGLDHPLRMVRGAATHYFHADRLGSIIALSTSAGAVAETYRYDTFGRPATPSSLGNRFLFTGREYDPETGLYYYRARYHDPRLGRFVSRDPLSYGPDEHVYRYVGNSPTMWVDPEGLKVEIGQTEVYSTEQYHTVIVLTPDAGGPSMTLSANPNYQSRPDSPFLGSLVATPNLPKELSGNLRNLTPIVDPLGRSDA